MSAMTVLVMESGARWPQWVERDRPSHAVVVAQQSGEAPFDFARRTVERLAFLEESPQSATLVCNDQGGADRNRLRETVLRAMLARAHDAGRGHVVLVADGSFGQQRALADLAARVSADIADSAPVSLRFRVLARPRELAAPARQVA